MLAALRRASLARMRFPLGDLDQAEVRDARAPSRAAGRRASPTRRTSASSPARGARAFLARHGGLRERPGDDRRPRRARLGRHRGHHHFTVGQRRGLGIGGEDEPLYVLATDARANTVTVGPETALADDDRPPAGRAPAHRRGRGRRREAPLPRAAVPCRSRGGALELGEPVHGVAPGQVACLLRGDVVVGCATIVV